LQYIPNDNRHSDGDGGGGEVTDTLYLVLPMQAAVCH
jgi:hypothetical protein